MRFQGSVPHYPGPPSKIFNLTQFFPDREKNARINALKCVFMAFSSDLLAMA